MNEIIMKENEIMAYPLFVGHFSIGAILPN